MTTTSGENGRSRASLAITRPTQVTVAPSCKPEQHTAVVLFYKYFLPNEYPFWHSSLSATAAEVYVPRLVEFLEMLGAELHLKGRILIATEGINGTLSATSRTVLNQFIERLESFDVVKEWGSSSNITTPDETNGTPTRPEFLFTDIDWKESSISTHRSFLEPFPDLKVSIVKEIVSSGGTVLVGELEDPTHTGAHLSPQAFHEALTNASSSNGGKQVVLIDVRSTFEHDIGHFIHPGTNEPAVNPEIVTFSSFDTAFCAPAANELKSKRVLLYCTGGIRCEKAAVQLKRRGVSDVSQLQGGIHRYLQEYGAQGHFQGLNFVFDQRVAMKPSEYQSAPVVAKDSAVDASRGYVAPVAPETVVGKCLECSDAFDQLDGSRTCSVCRDLILVCEGCQGVLREYHCRRHASWKKCYFTFLDVFSLQELEEQRLGLEQVRNTVLGLPGNCKNARRTLARQIDKVVARIRDMKAGKIAVEGDPNAPGQCRSCEKPLTVGREGRETCDGRCWGFWKTSGGAR